MPAAKDNPAYSRLVSARKEILATPAIGEKFATQGVEPGKLFGRDFVGFVDAEINKWSTVVKIANVPEQ
jgi:tripartite-type tricarboxylate transporter receptor subunit TctC